MTITTGTYRMSNTDKLSGRIKEATGTMTDDDKLKREGKVEQAEGDVKGAVDNVADKAKGMLDRDKG